MSFLNNPAGGSADLWGTNDAGQDDATLNDLLALYQSATDMPPFAPLADAAGAASADLDPALAGSASVDAEIDDLIKSFQEAPAGFPAMPAPAPEPPAFEVQATPAPEPIFEMPEPVFEMPEPAVLAVEPTYEMPPATYEMPEASTPIFEAPAPPPPAPPAPAPQAAPAPPPQAAPAPMPPAPSKPPSFDDILSSVQSVVPAAPPPRPAAPLTPPAPRPVMSPLASMPAIDASRPLPAVTVGTSRDRIALAQQLSEVVANLTGGIDRVQSDLDGLYSSLAQSAARRAPVQEILQTTQALADTKSKLGEGSDLYQQAMLLKAVGEAYMELLKSI